MRPEWMGTGPDINGRVTALFRRWFETRILHGRASCIGIAPEDIYLNKLSYFPAQVLSIRPTAALLHVGELAYNDSGFLVRSFVGKGARLPDGPIGIKSGDIVGFHDGIAYPDIVPFKDYRIPLMDAFNDGDYKKLGSELYEREDIESLEHLSYVNRGAA